MTFIFILGLRLARTKNSCEILYICYPCEVRNFNAKKICMKNYICSYYLKNSNYYDGISTYVYSAYNVLSERSFCLAVNLFLVEELESKLEIYNDPRCGVLFD